MKKLLFLLLSVLFFACTDYTEEFNTINDRLDKLEQALPSIDEQIENINAQLASLKEIDNEIKEQINNLEKDGNATATEIANLKSKDSALENAISDLQSYVDTQITNANSEAAAAYATIEQYNTIVAQLSALQASTTKLSDDLNAKIDAEVKSLNDKISDLENRLKAVEEKVEDLLARIQSVSYIPTYDDGKAAVMSDGTTSFVTLDFEVSPKDAVGELAKVWQDAVSLKAVYTGTRAVSFIDLPIIKFEADAANGVITITALGRNLSAEFFAGTQSASARLAISDGNNSVTSDYISMVVKEDSSIVPNNEIWYTSSDANIVVPYNSGAFGANIVSNICKYGQGVLTFDAPVTSIGKNAFCECISLTSIAIPISVTSIEGFAFWNCRSLTSITIPDGVTKVGEYAFWNCCLLTSARFGNSVTSIGDWAFAWCEPLTSVTISDSVTNIGVNVFGYCNLLKDTYVKISDFAAYATSNPMHNIGGVKHLLVDDVEITELVIPNSVTLIGEKVFSGCTLLTSVTIPDSVTEIGASAFHGCTSLTSITIPNSVTAIGASAFSGCTGELILNCNCLGLYGGEFSKLTIGSSVTSIGDGAFQSCSSLTDVTISEGITLIGGWSFRYCSSLTSIIIPDSVTSIKIHAFSGCTCLTSVYCKSTTPPASGYEMFNDNASDRKIYVPSNSVSAYKSALYWSSYASAIVGYDF